MPRGNKKGPLDEGPQTGRGLGYCTGHDEPGCDADHPHMGRAGHGMGRGRMGRRPGRGHGRGMGRGMGQGMGRGMRRGFPSRLHDLEERDALRRRVHELEARIADQTEES